MQGRTRFIAPVAVLAAALLAAATAASASPAKQHAGKTQALLKVAATAAVTTWDPVSSFSTEVLYLANIYEPLLWAKPGGSFRPGLASSWTKSAGGRTWTFHLRHGVTFHNGAPMTSADVKASIEAAAKRGGASFIWLALKNVTTPDPYTVVIHMKSPARVDLIASSEYGAWVVCSSALAAAAKDPKYFESGKDCGTGPYYLKSYQAGSQVVLGGYTHYWGGWSGNRYQNVVVQITPEAAVQQQQLQSGAVDLALSVPAENVNKLMASGKYTRVVQPTSQNYTAFFNTTRPPLDDPVVRKALSYAIPYQDIVNVGAYGLGTQSRGPVPKGIFPYNPYIPQYTYNLAKAKALLAQAGQDGGFSLTLTYAAENQAEARFAPLIKASFAKIGVKVTLKPILFNQQWALAKANPQKAQDMFVLLYWPTYSDAGSDNLYSLFHSSAKPFFNLSYWSDPDYDKLVDAGAAEVGSSAAKAKVDFSKAMQILYQQAPGAFLYDAKLLVLVPKYLSTTGGTWNINYPFVTFFYSIQKRG